LAIEIEEGWKNLRLSVQHPKLEGAAMEEDPVEDPDQSSTSSCANFFAHTHRVQKYLIDILKP
jgi:hypothetical protein